MNKMILGAAMGMMAGMALMMSPIGKEVRRDVNRGMGKAKRLMRQMERMK